jgi:hypothetical protein
MLNIIIDLIAMLLFLGMIATGYLLRFPLPPGTNKTLTLWGLSRHQWGDLHFWTSLGLLVVMLIHLALHWNWIVRVIGKRCHLIKTSQPSLVRSAIWTIVVFSGLCISFGWFAQRNVKELAQPICTSAAEKDYAASHGEESSPIPSTFTETKILVWNDVYPIFERHCFDCHGPQRHYAEFRVDHLENFLESDRHSPYVLPGQSSQSPLIAIVSGARPSMAMAASHKLADEDVFRIAGWIDQGAK